MGGKICLSVCAWTAEELAAKIRQAEALTDVIEIRFDCLADDQLNDGFANVQSSKPLIATYRSPEQGGRSPLSLEQRREFWNRDLSKFWAIDIEEDLLSLGIDHPNVILSFHDFSGVPNELDAIAERLFSSSAKTVKIAVAANDVTDAIAVWKLFDLAQKYSKQLIPIAMGEAGKWTRILGLAQGAPLTYASLDAASETADGQPTASELVDVYRAKDLDRDTQVYGVIGDPVSASRSPKMHNAAFKFANVNAVFIPLQLKDIDSFFTRMVNAATRRVELNFGGFSVTMPHKQNVLQYLDEIDDVAKAIDAVNTIKIDGTRLIGYNTDAHGFITSLKKVIPGLKGLTVAILGAGGAARACAYPLKVEGADVTVFARDTAKAKWADNVASMTGDEVRGFDIIVNATPLGMPGPLADETPLTGHDLAGIKLVYDLVTSPTETPLIRRTKNHGIPTIDGSEMLIEQGARQFEIWTGQPAPVDVMLEAIK